MASRIGVDIGGTFTDLIHHDDETGEVRIAKVPTRPAELAAGVAEAVSNALDASRIGTAGYFLHGTTVGLNALLERRGARLGLLATAGFRDVLEIRRGDREAMYDLFWRAPPALVPRDRRLPVTERILAEGTIHIPLDPASVCAAFVRLQAANVEAIAVALLNAYANPAHELECERCLRELGFRGEIALSHRISGEYREYERTSTTVIDAYIRGIMRAYLAELEAKLGEAGYAGACLVARSGGGSLPFAEAMARPFETIMSGPVGGAEGAGEIARSLRLTRVIAADVGGTSFDTCLLTDGRAALLYEGRVGGMPIQTPWVDVRSIGAGGGSIAYVDPGGLLRVGPQSAGAVPGPAAYGRGGERPTVTDCALALGMLGPGTFAAGLTLDAGLARRAIATVAGPLGLDETEAARGVLRIAAAAMASAIREVTIEQGIDPRTCTLLAFGGAGPLMMTLLADELEIPALLVPPHAGNFSAWGLLGADLTRSAARTRIRPLDDGALGALQVEVDELLASLSDARSPPASTVTSASLDLRYRGQEHWLNIEAGLEGGRFTEGAAELRDRFVAAYERAFRIDLDAEVEIVSVRATVRVPLPPRGFGQPYAASVPTPAESTWEAYSFTAERRLAFALRERAGIAQGEAVDGPAIIVEPTTTCYLDAGYRARADEHGLLHVARSDRLRGGSEG